jgi:hypothetical protein
MIPDDLDLLELDDLPSQSLPRRRRRVLERLQDNALFEANSLVQRRAAGRRGRRERHRRAEREQQGQDDLEILP